MVYCISIDLNLILRRTRCELKASVETKPVIGQFSYCLRLKSVAHDACFSAGLLAF